MVELMVELVVDEMGAEEVRWRTTASRRRFEEEVVVVVVEAIVE